MRKIKNNCRKIARFRCFYPGGKIAYICYDHLEDAERNMEANGSRLVRYRYPASDKTCEYVVTLVEKETENDSH